MYRYKKGNVQMYNTSQIQIETYCLPDYLDTINTVIFDFDMIRSDYRRYCGKFLRIVVFFI